MNIGLISDTHIDLPTKSLPPQLKTIFKGVDLILHAGDIWISSVLDELETIAPVKAAWGDDDAELDFEGDTRMMQGRSLPLDGVNLWLLHQKPRYGLINIKGERVNDLPGNEKPPDVVVFGHTHQAAIERYKGVLLVNPGSITLPSHILSPGTVAIMTIKNGNIDIRMIQL